MSMPDHCVPKMTSSETAPTAIRSCSASGASSIHATIVVEAAMERNRLHSNQRPAQPTAGISINSGDKFMPACASTIAASGNAARHARRRVIGRGAGESDKSDSAEVGQLLGLLALLITHASHLTGAL